MSGEQQKQTDTQTNAAWQYSGGSQDKFSGSNVGEPDRPKGTSIKPVEWSASEYINNDKNLAWFVGLFAIGILFVALIYAITQDVLASAVVLLCIAAMGVYGARKPVSKHYIIDQSGIHIDGVLHNFHEFRSFSVVEEGLIDSVWLKPLKRFRPMMVMYFSAKDEETIVNTLATFLPHEQRELDAFDKFSKKIRF